MLPVDHAKNEDGTISKEMETKETEAQEDDGVIFLIDYGISKKID